MSDFTVKHATAEQLGPPFTNPAASFVTWPRSYRSYETHRAFNAELARSAQSGIHNLKSLDAESVLTAHTTTIQTYSKPDAKSNEDRHTVQFWDLPSGVWTFAAVFDGHAGEQTVVYAVEALPRKVRESLEIVLAMKSFSPETISDALKSGIEAFDKSIADDLLTILPTNFEELSDEEVEKIAKDEKNAQTILRCMHGSTALIALIDPGKENLWVANLGDCQAVIARSEDVEQNIEMQLLTSPHNGRIEAEEQRIKAEHPNEEGAIVNGRVLGAIAVTRALGDHEFKLPAIYTNKIFFKRKSGFRVRTKVEDFIRHNLTPPYLSATPDVVHRKLGTGSQSLVLCTDGLTDLYHEREIKEEEATHRIVKTALQKNEGEELEGLGGNKALHILKDALGDNLESQSAFLTIDFDFPHLDDITVIVLGW